MKQEASIRLLLILFKINSPLIGSVCIGSLHFMSGWFGSIGAFYFERLFEALDRQSFQKAFHSSFVF